MTISYNWLCDYLPKKIEPEQLSIILTSIGLEVESMEKYKNLFMFLLMKSTANQ